MERHRHYMIVMDKDGMFHKAEPVASAEVGAEVEYKPLQNGRFHHFLLTGRHTKIAVMTVLVMLISFPLYAWFDGDKVYAYVNVDINPSVEMEVDEAMKVKSIRPLNEDAEQILDELGSSWINKTVEEVTALVIDQGKKDEMIDGGNVVIIGVSYLNGQKKEKYITDILDDYFNQSLQEELSVATFEVPEEIREAAKSESKSMNELFAEEVNKEEKADPEAFQIDDQEKELIESYYREEDHEEEAGQKETSDTSKEQADKVGTADKLEEQQRKNKQSSGANDKRTDSEKHINSEEKAEKKQANQSDSKKNSNKKKEKQEIKRQKAADKKQNKQQSDRQMKHTQIEKPNKKSNKHADNNKSQVQKKDKKSHPAKQGHNDKRGKPDDHPGKSH